MQNMWVHASRVASASSRSPSRQMLQRNDTTRAIPRTHACRVWMGSCCKHTMNTLDVGSRASSSQLVCYSLSSPSLDHSNAAILSLSERKLSLMFLGSDSGSGSGWRGSVARRRTRRLKRHAFRAARCHRVHAASPTATMPTATPALLRADRTIVHVDGRSWICA